MGSPLSPIVANLYMEDFEKRALLTSPCKPRLRVRYVNEVVAVWPHKDRALNKFHLHLNKQHPSIYSSQWRRKPIRLHSWMY